MRAWNWYVLFIGLSLSLISWGGSLLEGGQTICQLYVNYMYKLIADRDEAPFEGRVTDKHCFGLK